MPWDHTGYSDEFIEAIHEPFAHGATDFATIAAARRHDFDQEELWHAVCEVSRIMEEAGYREKVTTLLGVADRLSKEKPRASGTSRPQARSSPRA